jgi:hypothetical protein
LAEWLVERGIGEARAALVERGRIIEARIAPDGVLVAGTVVVARLADIGRNGRNAVARLADGTELLLPVTPPAVTEGAGLSVEILREAIPGDEPWKRPLARATEAPPTPAPTLANELRRGDLPVRELRFPDPRADPLEEAGWSDLLGEAEEGVVRFAGGELRISLTPAMTLIDVDGTLAPAELAVAGAAAAGAAIRRLAIGGSIGVDLPTVGGKAARQAAGEALDRALAGVSFERTAVNGFGFVQLVRPRRHASLLELAADRAGFAARALLRRAARATGAVRLAASPAVIAELDRQPAWTGALARQVGGQVTLRADPALAISAGHVEQR